MATYNITSISSIPKDLIAGDIIKLTTNGSQAWTVPVGYKLRIEAYGAAGEDTATALGGGGSRVRGEKVMVAGEQLRFVGYPKGTGVSGGGGGSAGSGGNAGYAGGRGGRGTVVEYNNGSGFTNILVGAGGGGAGGGGASATDDKVGTKAGGDGGKGGLTASSSVGSGTNGSGGLISSYGQGGQGGVGGTSDSLGGKGGKGGQASNQSGGAASDGTAVTANTYDGSGGGGGGGSASYLYGDYYMGTGGGGGGGASGKGYINTSVLSSTQYINTGLNNGGGLVEITILEVPSVKYLIQDGEDIKAYDGSAWSVVGVAPVTQAMFNSSGMNNMDSISDAAIRLLVSDNPEVLFYSSATAASKTMKIDGAPNGVLIMANQNINNTGFIKKTTTQISLVGAAVVKVLMSPDSGGTWYGKGFSPVDTGVLSEVKDNGFTPEEIDAASEEDWATIATETTRFCFYLEIDSASDSIAISNMNMTVGKYDGSPSIQSVSVLYEMLQGDSPDYYVSRNDGLDWKQVTPDTLVNLDELPAGDKIRVKAALSNGQEVYGISYSWI